ncbi:MAG: Holliday junction branch migration protein RuvA [Rhodospirillaceae bacterium]|nr:Holliday junction branch migration protein RuvA [Rhodospirillaceae bacterium]
MIGKLKGRVESLGADGAVIDVNGVGYEVFASARTLGDMAQGAAVDLTIETHVREDHIHLYAFRSGFERDVFRTLMTVQGVGAKVALGIMSALSADQISQAIAAADQAAFKRASGVGPKLAARIVQELKGKLPVLGAVVMPIKTGAQAKGATAGGGMVEDAVSALVNLGYARLDAFTAVSGIVVRDANVSLAALIKLSLREMGGPHG